MIKIVCRRWQPAGVARRRRGRAAGLAVAAGGRLCVEGAPHAARVRHRNHGVSLVSFWLSCAEKTAGSGVGGHTRQPSWIHGCNTTLVWSRAGAQTSGVGQSNRAVLRRWSMTPSLGFPDLAAGDILC